MSRAKKIVIFLTLCAIALGAIIVVVTLASTGFSWAKLSTEEHYERGSMEVHKDMITDIEIKRIDWDVKILPTDSKFCTVEFAAGEKMKDEVDVHDGKLIVKQTDDRSWSEKIGIRSSTRDDTLLLIYLPVGSYNSISIESSSGDVIVPRAVIFAEGEGGATVSRVTDFGSATVETTSGDVTFLAETREGLTVETTSGDLALGHAMGGPAQIKTTSGDLTFTDSTPASLEVRSTSGELQLQNVRVANGARVSTTSGDVKMQSCYASDLDIESTSGDVELRFDEGIAVKTETTSGDVTLVPDKEENLGAHGESCRVKTTSGDIYISRPPIRVWAY